jgi:hypothetical protein
MTQLSKPEQLAFPVLAKYGFALTQDYLPGIFHDGEDEAFRAKNDFYNSDLDIHVEVKGNSLNNKRCKRTAENAFNNVESWRYQKNPTYYQIKYQWNHSAYKQASVQQQLTPARFMIVFTEKPTDETLKLIVDRGIEAYSLDRFSWFMLRWRLRQYHTLH